jgi:starch synthase
VAWVGDRESVVVANPGHVAWMNSAAASLAEQGLLRALITPLAGTPEEIRRAERLRPSPLGRRVASELRKRPLPAGVESRRLERRASLPELCAVASKRLRTPETARRAIADWRDRRFDKAVARRLQPSDRAAHLAYCAALETIRAASRLGTRTLLEYPTHHHDYAAALLTEELELQPEYAPSMQFHTVRPRRRARLDAEIDAVDRVVVMSEASKRSFVESGVPETKVSVVTPGVDVDRFRPGAPRAADGFRVLFAGLITQRKGLSYLVDGFRQAGVPDSELLLVGAPIGSSEPWLKTNGVRRLSWSGAGELPEIYRSADVVVLPSLVEGFGRVILEAMATGVPVIVTPNTGAADLVDDGVSGFVVPIRDAGAIADRLRLIHDNPERAREMGAAARRQAERYPLADYGRRISSLISEVASGG